MSTVLPPAAALLLLLPALLLLLLLLLQPAAAKAIAARAAIAVVRLIIFFLSLIGSSGYRETCWLARFGLHAPPAAEDGRFDQILYGGRTRLGVDTCRCPKRGEYHREQLGRRFEAFGRHADALPTAVVPQRACTDPAVLALEEHAKVLSRGR
jgi:hypothetical protein